jgi:hypothetical protein
VEITATQLLEEVENLVESAFREPDEYHQKSDFDVELEFTKPEVIEYVELLKEWVRNGEITLFAWSSEEGASETNALLRITSESEYLFFMHFSYACAYGD